MRKMRKARFLALFLCSSFVPLVWAQVSDTRSSLQQAESSRPAECNALMFRFLPGEYNYCVGKQLWENGKYEQAKEMLELAAGWGSKPAQSVLGVIYFNGEGLAENRPLGLAWLALAAERDAPTRRAIYESALLKSTDDERRQAKRLLGVMTDKYGDGVAAVRADRRYRRQISSFRNNPIYGSGTCVAGVNTAWDPMKQAREALPVSGCSMASEELVARDLEKQYENFFEGWKGKVTVGDIDQVIP